MSGSDSLSWFVVDQQASRRTPCSILFDLAAQKTTAETKPVTAQAPPMMSRTITLVFEPSASTGIAQPIQTL